MIELLHVIKQGCYIMSAWILDTCSPRELNFVHWHLKFLHVFPLTYKNVHQFTCIRQKAADNSDVQGSLHNYVFSKELTPCSPFWHIEFGGHSLICKSLWTFALHECHQKILSLHKINKWVTNKQQAHSQP